MGTNDTNPVRLLTEKFLVKNGYEKQLNRKSSYVRYDGYGRPESKNRACRKVIKFVGVKLKDEDVQKLKNLLKSQTENLKISNSTGMYDHSGLRLTYDNQNYSGR